jgi:hypothetical protein
MPGFVTQCSIIGALFAGLALAPHAGIAATADEAACAASGDHPATAFVEPALLSGSAHRVLPCARVSGHMARFVIESRYGVLVADSVAMLRIRIGELDALQALDRVGVRSAWAIGRPRP